MSSLSPKSVSDLLARWNAGDAEALHAALLSELAKLNPQQGQSVELRFFGGLSMEESAQVLGLSPATVQRKWSTARI